MAREVPSSSLKTGLCAVWGMGIGGLAVPHLRCNGMLSPMGSVALGLGLPCRAGYGGYGMAVNSPIPANDEGSRQVLFAVGMRLWSAMFYM